jgi:two-component system, chemotaxis family, protein-glutamate methylesterase/glutaminase
MAAELVVVGTSLGGVSALEIVLSGLPDHFPLAIAVVQHRGADPNDILSLVLQMHSALPVVEPDDKEPIEAGRVYIAPADYHLLVDRGSFALSTEPKVCHARPSIDVLFESAADSYGSDLIGVILTGANADGSRGLSRVKQRGGFTIVQSPATAESAVMPEAAIAAVAVDRILPLPEISRLLIARSAER